MGGFARPEVTWEQADDPRLWAFASKMETHKGNGVSVQKSQRVRPCFRARCVRNQMAHHVWPLQVGFRDQNHMAQKEWCLYPETTEIPPDVFELLGFLKDMTSGSMARLWKPNTKRSPNS